MTNESGRAQIIRPGLFSLQVAADSRRLEFDGKNEVIVSNCVPIDYVFIGDSITHGWELNAYFGGQGNIVINRGIGGDKAEYMKRRFEADVIQLKPRLAVIKIGINDTWIMDDKQALNNDTESIYSHITANMEAILEMSAKHQQRIALCSLLPTRIGSNGNNDARNRLIVKVNIRLKQLADEHNQMYIDYHSSLSQEDGLTLQEGLADDGLHPNALGYNKMAAALREQLAAAGLRI
jgi:lysophospholipase L1-like esterase